jgi:hypothetical protein
MRRWTTVIGVIAVLAASLTLSAFAASFATPPAPRDSDLPRIVAVEGTHVGTQDSTMAGVTSETAAPATGPAGTADTGASSPASGASTGKGTDGTSGSSAGTGGKKGTSASSGSTTDGDNDSDDGGSVDNAGHDHEVVAPPVHDSDEGGRGNQETARH